MGNSEGVLEWFGVSAVHPHVHGELLSRKRVFVLKTGSSPRAWGTLSKYIHVLHVFRFIPTCMGNSIFDGARGIYIPVHPHVHGELVKKMDYKICGVGSSPRAWGTRPVRCEEEEPDRFIPTCMGNSLTLKY